MKFIVLAFYWPFCTFVATGNRRESHRGQKCLIGLFVRLPSTVTPPCAVGTMGLVRQLTGLRPPPGRPQTHWI